MPSPPDPKAAPLKAPPILEWSMEGIHPCNVQILVVDDQALVRVELKHILKRIGFQVLEAESAPKALAILDEQDIELLLCDICMPGMSGLELVRKLAPRMPDTAIVMVSGMDDMELAMDCLSQGAYNYILKPFKTNGIIIAVANALRRRMLELEHRDRESILARKVREQTLELRNSREEIAFRLLTACEKRDNETGDHVRRIGYYAAQLAALMGWGIDEVECIQIAAPMHDIGKIGVPDRILQKKGPLTDKEWDIMRGHTLLGANILKDSSVPFIAMGGRIAEFHHERFDGTGYPKGIAGKAIPIEARITTLVDVYDALCCRRVYKEPWNEIQALEYVKSQRALLFDPEILDIFVAHYDLMRKIMTEHPNPCAL